MSTDRVEQVRLQALPSGGADIGPRPWCRHCRAPAAVWAWRREQDVWWFRVECHGALQTGWLPQHLPRDAYRLEVFCAEPPHMRLQEIWFVADDGGELQAAPDVLSGGVFSGPVMQWCRRNATWIGLAPWWVYVVARWWWG